MNIKVREIIWKAAIKLLADEPDANCRAVIVQTGIAKYGPVPNSLADTVRAMLKPDYGTDCGEKSKTNESAQAVGEVVPEAGIEPATKGL